MFYENLEKILKQKNLTLNKLAKGTGLAQSPTSRWKNGTIPNGETIIKICKYLEISSDYLLDLNPEAPPILTDQELKLLEHYRQCDPGTQKNIRILADSGATESQEKETSLNLEKIG